MKTQTQQTHTKGCVPGNEKIECVICNPRQTHTPTPWTLNKEKKHPWVIECPSNIPGIMATIAELKYRPNAAFIVRAVNNHEALLNAMKESALILRHADQMPAVLQAEEILGHAIAQAEGE